MEKLIKIIGTIIAVVVMAVVVTKLTGILGNNSKGEVDQAHQQMDNILKDPKTASGFNG